MNQLALLSTLLLLTNLTETPVGDKIRPSPAEILLKFHSCTPKNVPRELLEAPLIDVSEHDIGTDYMFWMRDEYLEGNPIAKGIDRYGRIFFAIRRDSKKPLVLFARFSNDCQTWVSSPPFDKHPLKWWK